jgi:hypothetical protein
MEKVVDHGYVLSICFWAAPLHPQAVTRARSSRRTPFVVTWKHENLCLSASRQSSQAILDTKRVRLIDGVSSRRRFLL